MPLARAILLGKILKSGATMLALATGKDPGEHAKEIFEALLASGEAADKLRSPALPTLRTALQGAGKALEAHYETYFQGGSGAAQRETVETAFANLDEIFDTCLPSGAKLIELRYDTTAIAASIADAAVAQGREDFRNGRARDILVQLVTLTFASLDKNPTFMAALERVNWSEAFGQLRRIEDIGQQTQAGVLSANDKLDALLKMTQEATEAGITVAALHAVIEELGGKGLSRDDLIPWLKKWIEDAQRQQSRQTNEGEAFEIARREAEQRFQQGHLKAASAAFMEEMEREDRQEQERLAERKHRRLRLLAEAIRYDELAFDGEGAARKLRMMAAIEGIEAGDALGAWLDERAKGFYERGRDKGDNAALLIATAIHRTALDDRPRKRVPLDWAKTQNNLANALWTLGERESGTARLEEAVAIYRAALDELTREQAPLDWAMTQNNLGNALSVLGERGSGMARLQEAVTAYRAGVSGIPCSGWHNG